MYVCMYVYVNIYPARMLRVSNPRYCRSGRSASFASFRGSFDAAAASEEEDFSLDGADDPVDAVPTGRRLLEMTPVCMSVSKET